ncbi:hypothetical protein LRS06_09205 [Hymenobacter sp. J193]|uniref:hypothetical protein n=1 Tax=Hymenobacter sp. J193 TaxID=2898429 RepID=UPI00215084D7|nr:hypothetical protein [Hymenobacter sp. J193]MCR5887953.1 hypothetical protein [Hymenobacter sp. J193]
MLLLTQCSMVPGTIIMQNDFEQAGQANPRPPEISDELAHSGNFSSKLTKEMAYGPTWGAKWEEAQQPRKLRVQAWVNLPNHHQKTAFVVEVVRNDTTRYWKTLSIHAVVKRFHQWEFVWKTFVLPHDVGPGDYIRVYLWQAGERQVLYLDDFTIEKVS